MISHQTRETVLKNLIIIGIIAVAISIYFQFGRPYLAEISFRKQDKVRTEDLNNLSRIIKNAISSTNNVFAGKDNVIYISLPSDDPFCTNIDLPSIPEGWAYNCSNEKNYRKTNGTGWLPIDISKEISQLPIDPINKGDTLNYYSYVTSSTVLIINDISQINKPDYILTTVFDSKRYFKEKAQSDSGVDSTRYEVGNNLKLWSGALGLIAYWPINEGAGPLVSDRSKYNNYAKIENAQNWEGNTLRFDGNNRVIIDNSVNLERIGKSYFSYTILATIKSDIATDQSVTEKWIGNSYPFAIRGPYPGIRFALYDGKNNPSVASEEKYSDSNWHQIVAGRNTTDKTIFMYIDGRLIGTSLDSTRNDISNTGSFPIGARNINGSNPFDGYIKGLRIFNRILSPEEIRRIYFSEKD